MQKIIIISSLAILGFVSCGDSSEVDQRDKILEESAQNASSIKSITIESLKAIRIDKFEYQHQGDNEYIHILDLLEQLVIYGYDSQKYKIGIAIEGEAIQEMKGSSLMNIKGETLGEILDLICETTGTYYELDYGKILIKKEKEDP